jgi:hypothetical protein
MKGLGYARHFILLSRFICFRRPLGSGDQNRRLELFKKIKTKLIHAKRLIVHIIKNVEAYFTKFTSVIPRSLWSSDREIGQADYGQAPYRRWGTSVPNQ